MPRSCELFLTGINKKGQLFIPRKFTGVAEMSILHTSRLSPSLARPVERGLAMVVARDEIVSTILSRTEGIYTWQPKRPLKLAVAIATGVLAFGACNVAVTRYLLSR